MTGLIDAPARETPRYVRALRSLRDRRMAAMILLSFASGLPYGAVLGTLNAWLTKVGITPSTIGVLGLVSLGYAFKYIWAPAFQTPRPFPGLARFGARRSWLIVLQVAMAVLVGLLALSDPAANIGLVAFTALLISFLSPTHDLILDAWRIEVARSDEDKDLMSALYQFGYKSAGLVTGFIALLMAARFGWVAVYIMIALFLLLAVSGSLIAPEPANSRKSSTTRLSFLPALPARVALPAVGLVSAGWVVAFGLIGWFVIQTLFLGTGPKPGVFVAEQGPWIVGLTVLLPAVICALLVGRFGPGATETPLRHDGESQSDALVRTLFRAIFDPLMELVSRLKWGAALVLLLALTYRFTDAVWGTFAYPFYLGTEFGALGHTLDDVAIASKFFGVIATIFGSFLGAVLIAAIGRMPVFVVGGVIAAATNLLYADLATGGAALDAVLAATRLDVPLVAFAEWAARLSPEVTAIDQGQRMARLMITIFIENIAGGFALVAMTAYLTSVVNPRFAAVQYALLASLTMLLGTLGRAALGEMIETQGYYTVFIITFWLGGVAVVLSLLEWLRQVRDPMAASLVLEQD